MDKMNLTDDQKQLATKILEMFILLLFVFSLGFYTAYDTIYKKEVVKYDALQEEYTAFKASYSDVVAEREAAIIAKAEAEKKAKTPVIETVKGEIVTQIQYVEKTSPSDASVEVTNTQNPVKISYNGKTEDLPTITTEGKKIEDGKVVITQQSTTTLDIDKIVNHQIANTVDDYNKQIRVLKREKTQDTVWGLIGGVVLKSVIK